MPFYVERMNIEESAVLLMNPISCKKEVNCSKPIPTAKSRYLNSS